MKQETNFVVTCWDKRDKLQGQKVFPFSTIKNSLSAWFPYESATVAIYTYYKDVHSLPAGAMTSAVHINLKKLSVRYTVVLVTNNKRYRNIHRTYSCLDDLLCGVLNYLATTQETKMTYKDILTSGEN